MSSDSKIMKALEEASETVKNWPEDLRIAREETIKLEKAYSETMSEIGEDERKSTDEERRIVDKICDWLDSIANDGREGFQKSYYAAYFSDKIKKADWKK